MSETERSWKDALEKTPMCVTADQIAAGLSESQKIHVAACARCQTEEELWNQFSAATADEDIAVSWITAQLRRGASQARPEPLRRWQWRWLSPRLAAVAAVLAAVTAAWQWDRARDPGIADPDGPEVLRGAGITLLAPTGDQDQAPPSLSWKSSLTPARFLIEVTEVNHALIWRGESVAPSVALPPSVRSKAVPGKTLHWQVTAVDATGAKLATSDRGSFRVKTKPVPTGE